MALINRYNQNLPIFAILKYWKLLNTILKIL